MTVRDFNLWLIEHHLEVFVCSLSLLSLVLAVFIAFKFFDRWF